MLLICPHCEDTAEIPTILRKFYGLPIACHACASIFFVPRDTINDSVPATMLTTPAGHSPPTAERIQCQSCDYISWAPKAEIRADRPALRCPACNDHIIRPIKRDYFWIFASIIAVVVGGLIGAALSWGVISGVVPDIIATHMPDQLIADIAAKLAELANMIRSAIAALPDLIPTDFWR